MPDPRFPRDINPFGKPFEGDWGPIEKSNVPINHYEPDPEPPPPPVDSGSSED